MDQPVVLLRPAEPTPEEGRAYARYLDQAAEGFFRIMLGRRSEEIVAAAFTQPDNDYSYQNVIFAERDQRVVGMLSSFTGRQRQRFADRPLERVTGRHLRIRIVTTLLAPLMRILETIPEDTFYLQAIAVDPELRGAGIGSLLMNHAEERALASGSARLSLDVAAKNTGARRLYERRGWTVESEWPKSRFMPTLFVRMTKSL
jgi:ribosomal protein S18 acetylase RimI-like enzyme